MPPERSSQNSFVTHLRAKGGFTPWSGSLGAGGFGGPGGLMPNPIGLCTSLRCLPVKPPLHGVPLLMPGRLHFSIAAALAAASSLRGGAGIAAGTGAAAAATCALAAFLPLPLQPLLATKSRSLGACAWICFIKTLSRRLLSRSLLAWCLAS